MEHGTILDHLADNGPLIVDIDKCVRPLTFPTIYN